MLLSVAGNQTDFSNPGYEWFDHMSSSRRRWVQEGRFII